MRMSTELMHIVADGHLSTIPRSLIENSKTDRTSRLRAGDRDKYKR